MLVWDPPASTRHIRLGCRSCYSCNQMHLSGTSSTRSYPLSPLPISLGTLNVDGQPQAHQLFAQMPVLRAGTCPPPRPRPAPCAGFSRALCILWAFSLQGVSPVHPLGLLEEGYQPIKNPFLNTREAGEDSGVHLCARLGPTPVPGIAASPRLQRSERKGLQTSESVSLFAI